MANIYFNSLLQRKVSESRINKNVQLPINVIYRYLNTILFSVLIIIPLLALFLKHVSCTRSQLQQSIQQTSAFKTYGTTDNNRAPDIFCATVTPETFAILRQPWSVYNCVRVSLSVAQLVFIVYSTLHLVNKHDDIDKQVEGSYQDIVRMYYTRIVFWVCR